MQKKILVVSRHFWPEYTRLYDLCEKLVSFGFRVDVLCGQPSGEDGEFMKGYNSFKVRRETHQKLNIYRTIDVKKGNFSHIRMFLDYLAFPLMSLRVTKKLEENKYDAVLIYQQSPVMMCGPGLAVAKKRNIPAYIYAAELWPESVFLDLDVQSSLFRKFLYRLSMHYYREASKVIVTSSEMRRYFAEHLGMTDQELPVVTDFPDAFYEEDQIDDTLLEKLAGCFTLLIPGDFREQLSVETIIKTAEKIRSSNVNNIRFVVIGTGQKIGQLRKRVRQQMLDDQFYFEGKVPDKEIGKYLHVTDIITAFVKPEKISEYTMPHEIINYLAAGKPIAASLSGMVRELIRRAGCGFTTEPEDAAGMYSSIMKIYRMSEEERLQMGQKALDCRQAHFSRDASAQKIAWILAGEEIENTDPDTSSIRRIETM